MPFYEGASFPRVKQIANTNHQVCGIEVARAAFEDHGTWQCSAFATDEDGLSVGHSVDIEVVVAVPPQNVTLTVVGKEPLKKDSVLTLRLGSIQDEMIEFRCLAIGARPAPKFKWYIGETELEEGHAADSPVVERPDGKRDYAQLLKYTPSPRDTGRNISCTVEHAGYSADENGKEVSVMLDLYFKPQPNATVQTVVQTTSGLRGEGDQEVIITIRFEARPRPWEGLWNMAGVDSPVLFGSVSPNGNLNAGHIVRGTMEAEYEATLTIKKVHEEMRMGQNSLTVRNDEGETVYNFEIGLTASGSALNAIIVLNVTVLVVIMIVGITCVARFRGILCFSPDSESCASF